MTVTDWLYTQKFHTNYLRDNHRNDPRGKERLRKEATKNKKKKWKGYKKKDEDKQISRGKIKEITEDRSLDTNLNNAQSFNNTRDLHIHRI